jgi:hypothetical protein
MSKTFTLITWAAAGLMSASAAQAQNSAPMMDVWWSDGAARIANEQWASGSGARTFFLRVMSPGLAFSNVRVGPDGSHRCVPQNDPRVFRCDKISGGGGSYQYAISLSQMQAMPKSAPTMPDGWLQSE